jgi:hypothetical protein
MVSRPVGWARRLAGDRFVLEARYIARGNRRLEKAAVVGPPLPDAPNYFSLMLMTCTVVVPTFATEYGRFSEFMSAWPLLRVTVSLVPSAKVRSTLPPER